MSLISSSTSIPTKHLSPTRRPVNTCTTVATHFSPLPTKPLLPPIRRSHRSSSSSFHVPRCCCCSSSAAPLLQDAGATTAVLAGAYGLVLTFNTLTQRNIIKQETGSYSVRSAFRRQLASLQDSTSIQARYFATLVPLVNALRLLIYGLSWAKDESLIKSVTREGNPEELLQGPLYYVLILILCALIFWRESPIGVIALAMMCGGDGVADIMGRKFGSTKLPYNQQKSWAGSISMLVCGFLISIGMLYYYSALGYFQLDLAWTIQRVALVALVATVVESLPFTEILDDNISVPLATIAAASFCFSF
ncbi:Phytol kinase 1, chloroplastic [Turnera subulata]|uniref:phytol kinase n=1 Tax=Turnera subulata TaxID=218843 RepID=A0A9Q0G1B2_9ROSI|nr:Phytol kinase 1, chloroplastic [Turnera subulata]